MLATVAVHRLPPCDKRLALRLARWALQQLSDSGHEIPLWGLASLSGQPIAGLTVDAWLRVERRVAQAAVQACASTVTSAEQATQQLPTTRSQAQAVQLIAGRLVAGHLAQAAALEDDSIDAALPTAGAQPLAAPAQTTAAGLEPATWWGTASVVAENPSTREARQVLELDWAFDLDALRQEGTELPCASAASGHVSGTAASIETEGCVEQSQVMTGLQQRAMAAARHIAHNSTFLHAIPAPVAALLQQQDQQVATCLHNLALSVTREALALHQQLVQPQPTADCALTAHDRLGGGDVDMSSSSVQPPLWLDAFAAARFVQLGLSEGLLPPLSVTPVLQALSSWLQTAQAAVQQPHANGRAAGRALATQAVQAPARTSPLLEDTACRTVSGLQAADVAKVAVQLLHAHAVRARVAQQVPGAEGCTAAFVHEAEAACEVAGPVLLSRMPEQRPACTAHVAEAVAALPSAQPLPGAQGPNAPLTVRQQLTVALGVALCKAVSPQKATDQMAQVAQLRKTQRQGTKAVVQRQHDPFQGLDLWSIGLCQDWPVLLRATHAAGELRVWFLTPLQALQHRVWFTLSAQLHSN